MIRFRDFREDDRERIEEIAQEAFSVWTRFALDKTLPVEKNKEFFRREVSWYANIALSNQSDLAMIVAEDDGKVVGYIVVGIDKSRSEIYGFKWGYIVSLAVDPEHQGRGIGSSLIRRGLDWLRDKKVKYVEVLTDQNNIAAIRAYEKNNFRVIYSSITLSQYLY